MNQDQFLLKWNNHQNNFVEVFSFLRSQDAFVDVTLACDGKSFSAHKVVLSACSPYFQTLFQTNPCKHPIVFLKDVKGQELEALIEFIYKGEVSVSQSELASLISTAENLKIKGLAEPDRPAEKAVKRIASPPRSQPPSIASQVTAVTPISVTQHLHVKYPQSSPVAKRKKTEQFNVQSSYIGIRENQEEVVTVETEENGENLSLRGENLSLRGEDLTIREHPPPQVLLVPAHEVSTHPQEVTTHTPQPYASHHATVSASESVLYSVSGTAIYASAAQVTSSGRGGEQVTREIYPDQYHSSDESSVPGPSGVQSQSVAETSMDEEGIQFREATAVAAETLPISAKTIVARAVLAATSPQLEPGPSSLKAQLIKDPLTPEEQTIKLEPSNVVTATAESWEGSNQSYEDGGGSIVGAGSGAGVVPSTSETLTMQLPLHTEMTTEPSPLHDSSRQQLAAARALLRVLGAAGTGSHKTWRDDPVKPNVSTRQCRVCGETIARGEHRAHMASHTAHRPLHCAVCGRGFHQTEDLKRHIRIHTGEKPYKCSTCGVAFRQRGHLSRHVFKYHPEQRPSQGFPRWAGDQRDPTYQKLNATNALSSKFEHNNSPHM